jgi:hypothetical protein
MNPPGIDRQAEPEPIRASRDRSFSFRITPTEREAARLKAANPEAEEAIPAATGKLFVLSTLANVEIPARRRTRLRIVLTRSKAVPTVGSPFKINWSCWSDGLKLTVVLVVRPDRFMDMDPLAGRWSSVSISPQYLIKAMFGWAIAVAEKIGI